jgi:hypothetical protein
MKKYIVIAGDFFKTKLQRFHGTFSSVDEAIDWAESRYDTNMFWVVELLPLTSQKHSKAANTVTSK